MDRDDEGDMMEVIFYSPIGMFDLIEDSPYAYIIPEFWAHEEYRRIYSKEWKFALVDYTNEIINVTVPAVPIRSSFSPSHDQIILELNGKTPLMVENQIKETVDMENLVGYLFPLWMYRRGWSRSAMVKRFRKRIPEINHKFIIAHEIEYLWEIYDLKDAGFDYLITAVPFLAAINRIKLDVNPIVKRSAKLKDIDFLRKEFPDDVRCIAEYNISVINEVLSE